MKGRITSLISSAVWFLNCPVSFLIRTGRGGRNETNNGAPETVVLGAVNYMLGNTVRASLNNMYGE